MKSRIARSVATLAVGSLLAVAAGGVASASVAGSGNSSTEAVGAQVLQMRDQLTKVAYAGDVAGTQKALDQLTPVLSELSGGQRYSIKAEAQRAATQAADYSSEASRVLADRSIKPRQLPPLPALPKLPPPLSIVSDLLTNLLTLVTGLLGGLLGALPVPALPIPALPVPGVPALPVAVPVLP